MNVRFWVFDKGVKGKPFEQEAIGEHPMSEQVIAAITIGVGKGGITVPDQIDQAGPTVVISMSILIVLRD